MFFTCKYWILLCTRADNDVASDFLHSALVVVKLCRSRNIVLQQQQTSWWLTHLNLTAHVFRGYNLQFILIFAVLEYWIIWQQINCKQFFYNTDWWQVSVAYCSKNCWLFLIKARGKSRHTVYSRVLCRWHHWDVSRLTAMKSGQCCYWHSSCCVSLPPTHASAVSAATASSTTSQ